MWTDLIRQHADWYADVSAGINVQRANVPVDVGVAVPPAVNVYDSTRYAWVARGSIPRDKTGSGALILVEGVEEFQTWVRSEDAQAGGGSLIGVRARYVARKTQTDVLMMDCYNTLRCVLRVIALRFNGTVTSYTRNGTLIEPPDDVRFQVPLERLEGDELVVAELLFAHRVIDPWALANVSP